MRTLSFDEMQAVNGGECTSSGNKAIAIIGAVAFVASLINPITAIVAAPTSGGMVVASLVCAFSD